MDEPPRDITFLLRKYKTKQPGEANSITKDTMRRRRQNERLAYVDYLGVELNLTLQQRREVKELIKAAPSFTILCRGCSWECIVTAMAWHVKFIDSKTMSMTWMQRYRVCRENDLTKDKYCIIISRLLKHFMKKIPLGMVLDNYKIGSCI